ncbi:PepSY domain-containing protein [Ruegeria sp. HKCCD6228]|uniref:PepSY domain-containing protein n=1 Tax=Ruegeria atlantica TaxID=81569 RepID=A0ABX1WA94_9RHOB|nr:MULTISPECIES: PepSY domain-containing protein [Ruegeria]NOD30213.1 PepSY domain-containing protein [Ruegeria atlantica]NOD97887.1 PepSY domain-containing protein [Ruegeria sp. HKCCD6228]
MKNIGILIITGLLAAPASADEIDTETVERIEAYLASIECQMDPDDIEVEDDGYDLDDVICKGGNQFDIKLDKDLNEVSRKAE